MVFGRLENALRVRCETVRTGRSIALACPPALPPAPEPWRSLYRRAADRPDGVWIAREGTKGVPAQKLSYAAGADRVSALAAVLAGRGIGAGDRLFLLCPPGPDAAVALVAAARIGASAAIMPVDWLEETGWPSVWQALEIIKPKAVIVDDATLRQHLLVSLDLFHEPVFALRGSAIGVDLRLVPEGPPPDWREDVGDGPRWSRFETGVRDGRVVIAERDGDEMLSRATALIDSGLVGTGDVCEQARWAGGPLGTGFFDACLISGATYRVEDPSAAAEGEDMSPIGSVRIAPGDGEQATVGLLAADAEPVSTDRIERFDGMLRSVANTGALFFTAASDPRVLGWPLPGTAIALACGTDTTCDLVVIDPAAATTLLAERADEAIRNAAPPGLRVAAFDDRAGVIARAPGAMP